ncbi:GAF domain-containing protein [Dactylosporangium sp. CA-233914]|uniref:GAF domain-containing protein n=1 Tax=Dactylosporangium sp. CA-233914 TaxID=3239934 RepID=UPI003D8A5E7F
MRVGLVPRAAAWCVLYLVLMAGVAAVVLAAVVEQREASRLAARADRLRADTQQAERQLLDLDRTERGYLVSHEPALLTSWSAQHGRFTDRLGGLQQQARERHQTELIRRLREDSRSYVQDHALPTLQAARDGRSDGGPVLRDGDRRVAVLRADLDNLAAAEERLAARQDRRAGTLARTAVVGVVAGVAASALFCGGVQAYLNWVVVQPIRRAAAMAGRLEHGELDARVPPTGAGEARRLARALNAMGASTQRSVAQLVRYGRTQAALRRVAVRVAQGASPAEALDAVATEIGRLIGTDDVHIVRYDDSAGTVVAAWGPNGIRIPVGALVPLEGDSIAASVHRSGQPARMDDYDSAVGPLAARLRASNIRAAVGAPIIVEGRLWGVVTAAVTGDRPLAAEAAERLGDSTELIATTVANAQARADLAASRARVVVAADQARRRIERNLHDGVLQQLIAVAMGLRAADERIPPELPHAHGELAAVTDRLAAVVDDLREISRGIHPMILSDRGLGPALKVLARRGGLPAELRLDLRERPPEPVEYAAYCIAVEAADNAAKHARASHVRIEANTNGGELRLSVSDDGVGGADPARGAGLIGLADRVQALGGSITITSPPGEGTHVEATLPLDSATIAAAAARLG